MNKIFVILLGSLLLAACSPDSDKSEEKKVPIFMEGPMKAMDKAKGVQDTLNQAAEQQQQQIEEQTQ